MDSRACNTLSTQWLISCCFTVLLLIPALGNALPENQPQSAEELQGILPSLIHNIEEGKASVDDLVKMLVNFSLSSTELPGFLTQSTITVPGFEQLLGIELVARSGTLLKQRTSSQAVGLKRLAALYLKESDENLRHLNALFSLAEKIEYLLSMNKTPDAIALRKHVRGEIESELLEARLENALIEGAAREMTAKHPAKTLLLLAKLQPQRRNEQAISLARNALGGFSETAADDEAWPFDDHDVEEFSNFIAQRDTNVREILAVLYSRQIMNCVEKNDFARARKYLPSLLGYRPDPNDDNNSLRLSIAKIARGEEGLYFAREQVEALRLNGALTWMRRVQLLFSGYYGTIFFKIFLVSIAVAVLSLALAYGMPVISAHIQQKRQEETKPPDRRTVLDEYSELIALFHLDENSTEEQIKQTYRQLVKNCHPDSAPGGASDGQTEKFLELKRIYERILEINRSRFG